MYHKHGYFNVNDDISCIYFSVSINNFILHEIGETKIKISGWKGTFL